MDLDPSYGDTWSTLTSSEALKDLPFAYIFLHAALPQLSNASTPTLILPTLSSSPSLALLRRSIRLVTHRITGLLLLPRTKSSSSRSKSAVISDEVVSCLEGCLRVLKALVERVKEVPGGANDELKRELVADAGLKELLMMEKVPKGVRAGEPFPSRPRFSLLSSSADFLFSFAFVLSSCGGRRFLLRCWIVG